MRQTVRTIVFHLAAVVATLPALTGYAWAQQSPEAAPAAPPPPGADEMSGQLMFFTLGAGLLIAIALLLVFLRKRSNRAAAERVFNPKDRDSL